jgi:DNA-binding response OmpR family regulator
LLLIKSQQYVELIMRGIILVADDDPGIVDALQMVLEDADYEVRTATDGHTVRKVKEQLPDVILLDIWMSGDDGRDICRHLKSREATMNIPIIMISATSDLAQSAKAAGADDFLPKPFHMQHLLDKVEKHLKQ